MMRFTVILLCAGSLSASPAASGFAQGSPAPVAPVPDSTRKTVVDSVGSALARGYVFADRAERMADLLRRNQRRGRYSGLPAHQLAEVLQTDLRELSRDKHISVRYDPEAHLRLTLGASKGADPEVNTRPRAEARERNYGFRKVEVLEGNVGYLDLHRFSDYVGGEAGAAAVAAMTFLGHTDAIVLDLRDNPGGSGRMGQLLASYFFEPDSLAWLVSNENRSRGTTRQEWTLPYVPGPRMPRTPLYILVGSQTGSAAEGFAYNLQALGRATVVGRPTAGAAHSGTTIPVADGFVMFLPTGRTINPITGSNWEGTGVTPDVVIAEDKALPQALSRIWGVLKSDSTHSERASHADWVLAYLNAQLSPVEVDSSRLQEYTGTYEGARKVWVEDRDLYYQREGQPRYSLLPLGQNLFAIEGMNRYGPGNYRVTFVRNETGRIGAMRTLIRHAPYQVATFEDKRIP